MFLIIGTATHTNSEELALTIAPINKRFIYESLITGIIPSDLKHFIISPLIKKTQLDCTILSNYIPISQLPNLTNLLEKVIYKQIIFYITANNILEYTIYLSKAPSENYTEQKRLYSHYSTTYLNTLITTSKYNYCF